MYFKWFEICGFWDGYGRMENWKFGSRRVEEESCLYGKGVGRFEVKLWDNCEGVVFRGGGVEEECWEYGWRWKIWKSWVGKEVEGFWV